MKTLNIKVMGDSGDQRGASYHLGDTLGYFVRNAKDMHITTLSPGYARGNHYHARRDEIIIVIFEDKWSFHWEYDKGVGKESRHFFKKGAAIIEVPVLCAHAVRNDGKSNLLIISISNGYYDQNNPDSYPKTVI